MVWKSAPEQTAAFCRFTAFVLMIPLRLSIGVAAYYIAPQTILSVAMALGSLVTILFLLLDGSKAVACLVLSLGIIEGISVLNWIAVGDYFARADLGRFLG